LQTVKKLLDKESIFSIVENVTINIREKGMKFGGEEREMQHNPVR